MIYDTTWRESPADSPRPPADAGAFQVREVRYPPAAAGGVCSTAKAAIVVVLSGRLDHGDTAVPPVRPGAALVLPAGLPHRALAGIGAAGCHCLKIDIDPEWLDASGVAPGTFSSVRVVSSPHMTMLAVALRKALAEDADGADALRRAGLASELVATTMRECSPAAGDGPGWLPQVRDRLEADLSEPLTVDDLAAEVRVPAKRLLEGFAREYGESLPALIRRRRIDWAAEALAASDESIASIAISAGFFDQSHFTRAFKRAFGTTPAEQRRAAS